MTFSHKKFPTVSTSCLSILSIFFLSAQQSMGNNLPQFTCGFTVSVLPWKHFIQLDQIQAMGPPETYFSFYHEIITNGSSLLSCAPITWNICVTLITHTYMIKQMSYRNSNHFIEVVIIYVLGDLELLFDSTVLTAVIEIHWRKHTWKRRCSHLT